MSERRSIYTEPEPVVWRPPEPEQRAIAIGEADWPRSVKSTIKIAEQAGWTHVATYARGPWIGAHETYTIKHSIAVTFKTARHLAAASWLSDDGETWKFNKGHFIGQFGTLKHGEFMALIKEEPSL